MSSAIFYPMVYIETLLFAVELEVLSASKTSCHHQALLRPGYRNACRFLDGGGIYLPRLVGITWTDMP